MTAGGEPPADDKALLRQLKAWLKSVLTGAIDDFSKDAAKEVAKATIAFGMGVLTTGGFLFLTDWRFREVTSAERDFDYGYIAQIIAEVERLSPDQDLVRWRDHVRDPVFVHCAPVDGAPAGPVETLEFYVEQFGRCLSMTQESRRREIYRTLTLESGAEGPFCFFDDAGEIVSRLYFCDCPADVVGDVVALEPLKFENFTAIPSPCG